MDPVVAALNIKTEISERLTRGACRRHCVNLEPEIRAALYRTGQPIGPYDMMIAAQASALGLILVTNNVKELTGSLDWCLKTGAKHKSVENIP
jgi:hypothetical protein